jgi:hypothetical protein
MQQFGRLTAFFKEIYQKSYETLRINNQFLETIKLSRSILVIFMMIIT